MSNEQLVLMIQKGEDKAKNIRLLWEQNQGLIQKLSCSFYAYAEKEDLEQEGFIGLYNAVEHYHPTQGVKFITYASYWIQQSMSRYVRNNSMIRIPEHAINRLMQYKRMQRLWMMDFNRWPTDKEIIDYLDLSKEQVEHLKQDVLVSQMASLDVPVGEDAEITMYELLPGEGFEDDLIDKMQHEQLKRTIWPLVDELPGQQSQAIRERFQKEKSLEEVGAVLGVNTARAHTVISNGLRELRKPSRSKQLRPFYDDAYIYSGGLKGNGVGSFKTTWTSSTEKVVLKMAGEKY